MNREAPCSSTHRRPLLGLFLLVFGVWCGLQISQNLCRSPEFCVCGKPLLMTPEERAAGKCRPGPWGNIEYRTILIEPPRRFLDPAKYDGALPPWFFEGYSVNRLRSFLTSVGLTTAQVEQVSATAMKSGDGLVVSPARDILWSLTPAARSEIYSELSRWRQNPFQRDPFRFRSESPREWFVNSYLPESALKNLERLVYRRGNFWMFSDPELLMETITSPYEQRRLLQVLYRQQVLLPKLLIDSTSDVAPLAAYWGAGGRADEVQPLLESLVRSGHAEIDIELLLPEFARERMFFYRDLDDPTFRDCHWTSMNFFRTTPDSRFSNPDFVRQTILSDYVRVNDAPRFGDVILLRDADNEVLHSCVYIAADIVFTKNGGAYEKAWAMMFLQDVIDSYSLNGPLDIRVLRLKTRL